MIFFQSISSRILCDIVHLNFVESVFGTINDVHNYLIQEMIYHFAVKEPSVSPAANVLALHE